MTQKNKGLAGVFYKLRYMFVMNIDNKVGHFQGHLECIPRLPDPNPFKVRAMNPAHPEDVRAWMEIIADAYGEVMKNPEDALLAMHEHLFFPQVKYLSVCSSFVLTSNMGLVRRSPG